MVGMHKEEYKTEGKMQSQDKVITNKINVGIRTIDYRNFTKKYSDHYINFSILV